MARDYIILYRKVFSTRPQRDRIYLYVNALQFVGRRRFCRPVQQVY